MSAESTVSRNYWIGCWRCLEEAFEEIRDIKAAEDILNKEHYGLEKVKDRILEFLAVRQLVKNPKGSILCFVGPPGVGKLPWPCPSVTRREESLCACRSVECAMKRNSRASADLYRRPARPNHSMMKKRDGESDFCAGRSGQNVHGFPRRPVGGADGSAGPELNHAFTDHYLDVE